MVWSADEAMKAYMHALRLCKESEATCYIGIAQPKCTEYISALAAGNRAKLMVEISSGGIPPFTLALAIAAKYTGGRLICLRHELRALEETKALVASYDLADVVRFEYGSPHEVIRKFNNIDFAIIDSKVEDCLRLFQVLDMNQQGSVVVVNNVFHERGGASYAQLVKGRDGIESVVLPIGEGMEVTRIGRVVKNEIRRSKRGCMVLKR